MKILINAIHTQTGGGLVYLTHILPFLCDRLQKEGHDLHFLCHKEQIPDFEPFLPETISLHSLPFTHGFFKTHLWEQVFLPFWARSNGFGVLLCNANYAPLIKPKNGPLCVIIIHNNPNVLHYARSLREKLYWHTLKLLTRLSLWRCAGALSVAEHIIPVYANTAWSNLLKKIRVAHPACVSVEERSKPREKSLLLAVGDIYIQKNYPLLLGVLKRLHNTTHPDAKLCIIGHPVDTRAYKELSTMVSDKNLGGSVIFSGRLPFEKIKELYQTCTVYVNASLVECFNMTVLEALAHGAPTVVGDFPFQREVGGDAPRYANIQESHEGGMPRAIREFTAQVCMILSNPEEAARMEEKGQRRAQKFSWEDTAQCVGDVVIEATAQAIPVEQNQKTQTS